MNNEVTQEQIDAFNEKWQNNIRTKQVFEPLPQSEETKKYWEMVNGLQEKKKREWTKYEAKELLLRYLYVSIGKADKNESIESFKSRINEVIKSEKTYIDALRLLTDFVFKFENPQLTGRGGIIIWSAAGIGKTTILRAACQCAYVVWNLILKPGSIRYHSMVDDISKKINGGEVDLFYNYEGHLFLDDISEKINQVSHYGDYKFSLNELFQVRYELWKNKGYNTVITTNLHPSDENGLDKFIDQRTRDRIREMYSVCMMYGKSKRN